MANDHHISFTGADIERYHRGLMSVKERHAIEKAALDDPFLADAMEGYINTQTISEDLSDLKQRLANRVEEKSKVIPIVVNKPSVIWWKAAAMIVLIAGTGLVVYQLAFNNQKNNIAQAPQQKNENTPGAATAAPPAANTSDSDTSSGQSIKPGDEAKSGNQPLPQTNKKKDQAKQATPPAPKIATSIATKDSTHFDAVRGIVAQKAAEEAKADNTLKNKTVSPSNSPASQPVLSSAERTQRNRKAAAPPQAVKEVQQIESFSPTNIFRGRVTDMQNNALPFSNITNKEDNVGTYTHANGYFTLISPDTLLNVEIKSLGFVNNNVRLNSKLVSNQVHLQEDRTSLNQVVISNKKVNSNRPTNNSMILDDAEPADGWANYDLYLVNNLKTPGLFNEKQKTPQGEVHLSFEVSNSGEPTNITVKKSLCESCDKEAIRLLKEGPKWKRKAKKGKTTVTIAF